MGRQRIKSCAMENCGIGGEDCDTFVNIFEGGFLLYSNLSFEAPINVRKHLEELDFPCKAVNDTSLVAGSLLGSPPSHMLLQFVIQS